jgi:hypothetical protein
MKEASMRMVANTMRNERMKQTAQFLDNLAAICFAVGIFTPFITLSFNERGQASIPLWSLAAGILFGAFFRLASWAWLASLDYYEVEPVAPPPQSPSAPIPHAPKPDNDGLPVYQTGAH